MTLQFKQGSNQDFKQFFKNKFNFCDAMSGKSFNPVATHVINSLGLHIGMQHIHPCPYYYELVNVDPKIAYNITHVRGEYKCFVKLSNEMDSNIMTIEIGLISKPYYGAGN